MENSLIEKDCGFSNELMAELQICDTDYLNKIIKGEINTDKEKKDVKNITKFIVKKFIQKLEPALGNNERAINEITEYQMKRFFAWYN